MCGQKKDGEALCFFHLGIEVQLHRLFDCFCNNTTRLPNHCIMLMVYCKSSSFIPYNNALFCCRACSYVSEFIAMQQAVRDVHATNWYLIYLSLLGLIIDKSYVEYLF
jgi:hypothetical protein